MSVLEEILGAFSPGHALEHEGKRFVFKAITQQTKSQLSCAYWERARKATYAVKDMADPQQYGELLKRLTDEYRRGDFSFPQGESFAYYLGEGRPEMVVHLTGCTQEDAEALCMAMPVEVLHVLLCVVTASFPDVRNRMVARAGSGLAHISELAEVLAPTRTPSPDTTPPASSPGASTPTSSPA